MNVGFSVHQEIVTQRRTLYLHMQFFSMKTHFAHIFGILLPYNTGHRLLRPETGQRSDQPF